MRLLRDLGIALATLGTAAILGKYALLDNQAQKKPDFVLYTQKTPGEFRRYVDVYGDGRLDRLSIALEQPKKHEHALCFTPQGESNHYMYVYSFTLTEQGYRVDGDWVRAIDSKVTENSNESGELQYDFNRVMKAWNNGDRTTTRGEHFP